MGNEDPRKLAAAIVVLVLALGSLGFQIFRRTHAAPAALAASSPAMVADVTMEAPFVAPALPGIAAPVADLGGALGRNPFLRPDGEGAAASGADGVDGETKPEPRASGLTVTGVRTGPRPMAIIDDRTVRVGDNVRGWTVGSIERDRVTLENSHGRTLVLDLR